jgi:hypothetical protein
MTAPAATPEVRAARSRREWRLGISAVLLAAVGWACLTPYGGWVQSFFFGTGVRWQNAYTALDTAEANLPRNERERERMLMINLATEDEAPIGLKMGPRLHPPGTLATLRYELFDENGESYDQWDVRALVPNIGNGQGPFWREPCDKACREEIASGNGTHIERSGDAGIAEEYVLRMPIGQAFSLKPRPLRMQDILDKRERSIGLRTMRIDKNAEEAAPELSASHLRPEPLRTQDVINPAPPRAPPSAATGEVKFVQVPTKILVTLVSACKADVRVGTAVNLKIAENAILPVPIGFVVSRWAQLDGCGKLVAFDPPPMPPPVVYNRPPVEHLDYRAALLQRDPKSGAAVLKADEAWLKKENIKISLKVQLLCRYNPETDKWQRLTLPDIEQRRSYGLEPLSDADAAFGNRVIYELPRETGLYWLHWSEDKVVELPQRKTVYRHAVVVSGPVLCNEIALGEAPTGKVAACVPFAERAEARFVPEPHKACSQ